MQQIWYEPIWVQPVGTTGAVAVRPPSLNITRLAIRISPSTTPVGLEMMVSVT